MIRISPVSVLIVCGLLWAWSAPSASAAACASGSTSWVGGSGSWDDPAHWDNGTPSQSCDVAITANGDYTVSITAIGPSVKALTLGGSTGTQTLAISSANVSNNPTSGFLFLNNGGTVNAHGAITMNSPVAAESRLCAGPGLVSQGTITTTGTAGPHTFMGLLTNQGTMNINADSNVVNVHSCGGNTLNNSGTINVAGGATFTNQEAFNQTGGTTVVSGTFNSTGTLSVTGGSFTGNPATQTNGTIDLSGATGTFILHGDSTLTGGIAAGATLREEGTASADAHVQPNADYTNAGHVILTSTDAGHGASFDAFGGGGFTITNTGTIESQTGAGGTRLLGGHIVNPGTISIGSSTDAICCNRALNLDTSGNVTVASGQTFAIQGHYTQSGGTLAVNGALTSTGVFAVSGGTLTGNAPVLTAGSAAPSGGSGTIILRNSVPLTSDVGAGITVQIEASASGDSYVQPTQAITNHGTILLTSTDAAHQAGLDGTIGKVTNAGTIQVLPGAGGTRVLGGAIDNPGTVDIQADTTGQCCNHGLSLANTGTLDVHPGVTFTPTAALTQTAGTLRVDGTLDWQGRTLDVAGGTLQGTGTLKLDTLSNSAGTVAPGDSPGVLTVDGKYTQAAGGTLAVEVAGTAAGSGFDQLHVTGTAALAGTLAITTVAPFSPPGGSAYKVVAADGTRSGQFATVTGLTTPDGAHYTVAYNPSDVTLTATAAPRFGLTVRRAGTGSGRVRSTPGGIDCGSACSASYVSGTAVTLNATAAAGSRFTGWSGACTGTGACHVQMTQARSVTATFAKLLPSCGQLTPASVRATKQGRITFAVRNRNASRLAGSVKLRVTRGQLGLKTRRSAKVTIGQARFRAPAKGRARITLRLTAPARAYLRKHARLVAAVSVALGGRTCPARLTIKRPA